MTPLDEMKAASVRRIVGPTILLGSGNYWDFENPEGSIITVEDIAFGLGFEGRFAGQCFWRRRHRRAFYSVAQHCHRMSFEVPKHLAYDALMHEVGEAVCGDVTGPLKSICPDFKANEKRCEAAILRRFKVPMLEPDTIKLFDLRMLATERRDLLSWRGEEWAWTKGAEPFEDEIEPYDGHSSAMSWLTRFYELAPREVWNQ